MGADVWPPRVYANSDCRNGDHVWKSWSNEWETIGPEITIPVLVRRCSLCPAVEYANRQTVAA